MPVTSACWCGSVPERVFVPPYVGPSRLDWGVSRRGRRLCRVARLLREGYALVAPKRLPRKGKPTEGRRPQEGLKSVCRSDVLAGCPRKYQVDECR